LEITMKFVPGYTLAELTRAYLCRSSPFVDGQSGVAKADEPAKPGEHGFAARVVAGMSQRPSWQPAEPKRS